MLINSSIDNYEIIKEIGKGSFSNVFLARKKENQKEYALKKVNLTNMSTKERENALKEVNFLAEIKDNNVIGYEESFYDNNLNILYLVMEYAPYGDLNKIINKNKNLKIYFSETELLNIYLQIASGLKAIHSKQIIHRDLKSANIFITQQNDLILKIGDFNVSKKINYLNLKNTQTGTPYYASPEIWENKPYDLKSDIWSLGCLFYEIATYSTPFKGLNMKELFECIEKGIFAPLPKQYSNDITKIIKMCLRHDANLRPDCGYIKYFIENLKSEQHFKNILDEHYFDSNVINNNYLKNNIKRPFSYLKKYSNLNLDNYELPELDNSTNKNNLKSNNNLKKQNYYEKEQINYNINNNYLNIININNEKKKRNLTPIKINYHYLIRDKTPPKIKLNSINTEFNKKKFIIKDTYHNKSNKTDNNIINTFEISPDKDKKEYIKLKPPPYKMLKIINSELEEINKKNSEIVENVHQNEENAQKFNTIKNPLKQTDSKASDNNSQSIPENISINNSDTQNSQNLEKIIEKANISKDINKLKSNNMNLINDFNNKNKIFINNNNNENVNEENKSKKENCSGKNINLKTKNNKDILLLLKPNGYFFHKKPLKSFSTLNINNKKSTSSSIIKNLINNNDNTNKIFDGYNNNNIYKNSKQLSRIRLKPIIPSIRSITPFNDNYEKNESRNDSNKLNLNLINKKYNNSINEINNNIKDNINYINNNLNNDKRYFIKEKKNIRQLNINKNKLNNLSQIKIKFLNFIKPNYKNIENIYNKTEI